MYRIVLKKIIYIYLLKLIITWKEKDFIFYILWFKAYYESIIIFEMKLNNYISIIAKKIRLIE